MIVRFKPRGQTPTKVYRKEVPNYRLHRIANKAGLPPMPGVGQLNTKEIVMKRNDMQIEKSEGAKQIEKLCYDITVKLDLELESVYWSFEFVKSPRSERHILNVKAKNGMTTEIRFSGTEVEACTTSPGREITQEKIRMELQRFL